MLKNRENYLTTKEVGYHLGFTADHVRRLILQGKIKAEKVGNNWLIKMKDLKITRQRFPRNKD